MKWLSSLLRSGVRKARIDRQRQSKFRRLEALEARHLMASDPLPVLMVIADQRDFYYQEYGDTRQSLEEAGLTVRVAATTTSRSLPHPNTGEPLGTDGGVTPDVALSQANAADYSAIVFVGGWGSSMYQYAYNDPNGDGITDNYYAHDLYNGDADPLDGRIAPQKVFVNDLIDSFLDDDKPVAAVCHGVTVLAWARVDGVSPLAGRTVSAPFIGSPATYYQDAWYGNFELGQYEQVAANGGIANTTSGQYGDPTTVADDVVVDGRIITAENYDAARHFGRIVAQEVIASAGNVDLPPANQPPNASDSSWTIAENSVAGTVVGTVEASDPDVGQTLTYTLVGGDPDHAFVIDPSTGAITVSNVLALDFESTPVFQLVVAVTDDGAEPLTVMALVAVHLLDVLELPPGSVTRFGDDLIVQGTSASDTVYVWSGARAEQVFVWMNGASHGPYALPSRGTVLVHGGDGNDRIYATDTRIPTAIHGNAGHDQITGGSAGDRLEGGTGVDRLWGCGGDDWISGGSGNDFLYGREGNDLLLGGDGDDTLDGHVGRDLLIGGLGKDHLIGGGDDDLLIGGTTDFDHDDAALGAIRKAWLAPMPMVDRAHHLATGLPDGVRLAWRDTVHDDGAADTLCGGLAADLMFAGAADAVWSDAGDLLAPMA